VPPHILFYVTNVTLNILFIFFGDFVYLFEGGEKKRAQVGERQKEREKQAPH